MTSLKLAGRVQSIWVIETEDDLNHIPKNYKTIGAGSNIIIDPNISYPLIKVSPDFVPITIENDCITCSAGTSISKLLKWMSQHNRSGLEFAAGVPASIGGMVAMNFECWGVEVSTFVDSVLVYTTKKASLGIQVIIKLGIDGHHFTTPTLYWQ